MESGSPEPPGGILSKLRSIFKPSGVANPAKSEDLPAKAPVNSLNVTTKEEEAKKAEYDSTLEKIRQKLDYAKQGTEKAVAMQTSRETGS